MKKLVGFLLIASLLCSMLALGVSADAPYFTADQLEKKFVVDGNLDIWYLNDGDAQGEEDYNTYHYTFLDSYVKMDGAGNGVNFYPDYETAAQVWTAWDDDYVYIYAKVWDNEIKNWDPEGEHSFTTDSAYVDSVELWFDPDPNSQTHSYTYDENGKIIAETPKLPGDITDGWWAQTQDPAQGDLQVRWLPGTKQTHGYHPIEKPGYDGINFADWVNNPENLCYFTFDNEPVFIDGIGEEVSEGYGVEARFPRNNDKSNAYVINVAVNNSAEEEWERYALATGAAWWQDYLRGWKVDYLEENPFFNQSAAQLAEKVENFVYTDSYANVEGAAGKVVAAIDALGEVTAADRAKVAPVMQQYVNLTVLEQGYVQSQNYAALAAAWEITGGGELPDQGDDPIIPDPKPEPTYTLGDINGDGEIKANDALEALKAVVGKVTLTETQELAGDVNKDGEVKANDALEILKKVVGKPTCF